MKAARTSAENMGLKCISEEALPSETSWYTPKIGTLSYKSGVIYRYKYGRMDCEGGIYWGIRQNFCRKVQRTYEVTITGQELSLDNFCIVGRQNQNIARAIKEAILLRVNEPSLNRNIGKYQLPHVWDEVLVK